MKICVECKHYLHVSEPSWLPDSSINHLCQVSPIPKFIDPVTGEERPRLGTARYYTCNEINTYGECVLWERREPNDG